MRRWLLLIALLRWVNAFQPNRLTSRKESSALYDGSKGRNGWNLPNPLKEVSDMLTNFDDVIDDFMGKRMGNGEVFYGKRKYKPSGRENTQGDYNGMGLSDKGRIDVARDYKEELLEKRRERLESDQEKRS